MRLRVLRDHRTIDCQPVHSRIYSVQSSSPNSHTVLQRGRACARLKTVHDSTPFCDVASVMDIVPTMFPWSPICLLQLISHCLNVCWTTNNTYCSRCWQIDSGVNLFPTLWGSKVPSFPSHHLSFPPIPLSPFPFPLRSSFLNPARGSGKRCKLPQWGLGRSPSRQRFWCILRVKESCWWHSICTVSNNRKRLFFTFYEEIFQELTIAFIL